MGAYSEWHLTWSASPEIFVGPDVAAVAFRFEGAGKLATGGRDVRLSQNGTQVWRKTEGEWRNRT